MASMQVALTEGSSNVICCVFCQMVACGVKDNTTKCHRDKRQSGGWASMTEARQTVAVQGRMGQLAGTDSVAHMVPDSDRV